MKDQLTSLLTVGEKVMQVKKKMTKIPNIY